MLNIALRQFLETDINSLTATLSFKHIALQLVRTLHVFRIAVI